jgi:CRISPR/Cas system CMR-associated protein Cmr5 small subunit
MTRQQRWSKAALERVHAVATLGSAEQKKGYNTLCHKMPALIQRSGLVQAVVFVQSRGGAGVGFLNDLACVYGLADASELRSRSQDSGLEAYMALTRDLLDVSIWFRRFAQIELGDPED